MVWAFDGIKTSTCGEIDLKIGPCEFEVSFVSSISKYHSFKVVSINYIPEGGVILKPKLSKAELMISRCLIKGQYELRTGLGEYEEGIGELVEIKSQGTTFCVGFNLARKISKLYHTKARKKTC